MTATGRDLRQALYSQESEPNSNLVFYIILAGIFVAALIAILMMLVSQRGDTPVLAEAEISSGEPVASADIRAEIQKSPVGQIVQMRTQQMAKSAGTQDVYTYNAVVSQLRSCLYNSNNDARIRTTLAAYEKRNEQKVDALTDHGEKMMDRMAKTGKMDLQTTMWAMNGGIAKTALNRMATFEGSVAGTSQEKLSSSECSQLVTKVQRKELDIQVK